MSAPTKSKAELIAEYIKPADEWTPPYDALISPYAVRVRAVIGQYRATGEDPTSVAHDYDLPLEAVLACYRAAPAARPRLAPRQHRPGISARYGPVPPGPRCLD